MTENPNYNNLGQYPRVSFKKCVIVNHQKTISLLSFSKSKQLLQNPTVKRCLDMHFKDERQRIFTFLAVVVLMKIGTKIVHMNRAIALSAPRNWTSVLFKYFIVPYMASTYKYMSDIKRTIMEIDSQVGEDPQADDLWQPIFQQKYPDISQPFYSSPFTQFKLQDVISQTPTTKQLV